MGDIKLKALTDNDTHLLFQWRNSSFIASLGTLQKKVEWDEHKEWVTRSINSELRKVYIVLINDIPAGQIRFDKSSAHSIECVISIYLIEAFTGKGFGVEVIECGCEAICSVWKDVVVINAFVLKNNILGQKAFKRSGFAYEQKLCNEHHQAFTYKTSTPIFHNKLFLDDQEAIRVAEVVNSGFWAGGEKITELEERLKEISQRTHAVVVSSGLSAIRIALLSLNISKGDEFVFPAYSCVAIVNAILSVNAIPVPVDIEPNTYNIDPIQVKSKITSNTKAIIAIHTFGMPAKIFELMEFNIPVIEDCAHALGSISPNTKFGVHADVAVCSFYATKYIGGGEGGAILTNNNVIASAANDYRDYTDKKPSGFRLNEKNSDVHAALTLCQIDKISDIKYKRLRTVKQYNILLQPLLKKFPFFEIPNVTIEQAWYRYVLKFNKTSVLYVLNELKKENVFAEIPVERWQKEKELDYFPNTKLAFEYTLSLPLFISLNRTQQKIVVNSFQNILSKIYEK